MLKKVLFVTLVVTALLFGVIAINEYNNETQKRKAIEASQAAELERLKLAYNELQLDRNKLKENCGVGLFAYSLLEDEQREEISPPDCSLEILP